MAPEFLVGSPEGFSKLSGILETELPESNVEVTEAVYLRCGIV
jgi:hypothetical protein